MSTTSDDEEFMLQVENSIQQKEMSIETQKYYHLKSMKKMQIVYYILGFQITVYSSIVSFLSGIYAYKSFSWFTITILCFSLLNTILNAILQFSNVVQKKTKHRDAYNKFDLALTSIEQFKLKSLDKQEILHYIEVLDNTISHVNEYRIMGCCFDVQ